MKRKDHPTETGQVRKRRKITSMPKSEEQAKITTMSKNEEHAKTPKRKREPNKNIQSLESVAKKAKKLNGEEKKTPKKKASDPAESCNSVCQKVENHIIIGSEKNTLKIQNRLEQPSTRNLIEIFETINGTTKPKPKPSQEPKKTIFNFNAEPKKKNAPNPASILLKSKVKPSTPAKKKKIKIKCRTEPNFKFKQIHNYFEKVKTRRDEGGGDSEQN